MFLFLISFLLVFISSYLLTSIIAPKKSILGVIYFFLIAFAQIVLTFEVLSLFKAINQFWVITLNILTAGASFVIWNKNSRPRWSIEIKDFRNKVNNAFKLDKSLIWLYVGFLTFIIVALLLNLTMPITNADALAYHAARSLFWVLQGSLNHFEVSDIRNLCLPINSEILYAWVLMFLKTDLLLGFFSFTGFLLSIISIYNILGLMGYCVRKRLWVIFILSSFASVIVQISGTETDIIIAGLATSCIFLFWYALKHNEKVPVFMAALAYALALGTKTTSIIAIPGVALILLALCYRYKNFKPLGAFLGFGILNFFIFSSYNYILNLIHFHSISGPTSFMIVSKNYFGLKGMISNFIKYIFMFIDFTGFTWGKHITPQMIAIRNNVLNFLHIGYIPDGLYTMPYQVNQLLLEPVMGAGVLGLIVFLPCTIWALIKPIFKRKSKKTMLIGLFALAFIINLISISYLLAYMSYSVRFVMSFMVISAPILVYSYCRKMNPLKFIIIFFALFYFLCISTHLWPRPFMKIARIFVHEKHTLSYLQNVCRCKDFNVKSEYTNGTCILVDKIQEKIPSHNKILAFLNTTDSIFILKALEFKGYNIDFAILEDVNTIDFDKYDYVIMPNNVQKSSYIKHYEERKDDYKIKNNKVVFDKEVLTPCVYEKNITIQKSPNKESQYPYQSLCELKQKFFDNHHLVPIIAAGLLKTKINDYNYYIIYLNTNPQKMRKH